MLAAYIGSLVLIVILSAAAALKLPFNFASSKSKTVDSLKEDLLQLTRKVNRGISETPEDRVTILSLFEELEKKNKDKNTLARSEINAVWSLEYTTSDSILGRGGSPRIGPIFQQIDAINGKAQNSEVVRYFGFLNVPRKVSADLTPVSPSKVNVRFRRFTIGPISFNAPAKFTGSLDTTYLDKDLRLSRGDKGNIFVLTRYSDLPDTQ